jgi:hypothetical protein
MDSDNDWDEVWGEYRSTFEGAGYRKYSARNAVYGRLGVGMTLDQAADVLKEEIVKEWAA